VLIATVSTLLGILLPITLDLPVPSGAAIILVAGLCFALPPWPVPSSPACKEPGMTLKKLTLALALSGLPLLANATQVLTTLPVTHSLAAALLDGTSVQLKSAVPANLPASRQPSYFEGRGGASLQKAAQQADAVIGVRSIWRDDPLYPMARRSNIRIVEIDAARPVDGALPGIAVKGDQAFAAYPWLNPTNLGRMADVLANDLERLAPADKAKIQGNLAGLKRQMLELTASSQAQLAEVDNLSVVSLSERLGYLASG
jgi:ABC-type Zn uptake system ZnuABC Zn-binding protein ZnuA